MYRLKINHLQRVFKRNFSLKANKTESNFKKLPLEHDKSICFRFRSFDNDWKKNTNIAIICASIFSLIGLEKEETKESDLIITIKRSVLLIQRDELIKAEQMLHLALRMAQQTQNELAITYVYDVMANLALQRGELKKAEKLFVTVMQRLISNGFAENNIKNIHISMKLARICHLKGENEKAAVGYKWSIEKLEKTDTIHSQNDLMLLTQAKDWYARLLIDEKKYKEALVCLEESLKVISRLEDQDTEHIVMLFNDMATVSEMMEDYVKSEEYLIQAINISRDIPEIYDIGTMHVNLGRINIRKGLYEVARKNCGLGLKLGRQRKNDETVDQAKSCLKDIEKNTQ